MITVFCTMNQDMNYSEGTKSHTWFYGLTKDLKSKLQVTQNKLIRFVLNLEPRSHIGNEDFIKLNWLPLSDRVDQVTLCNVFKMHNNLAPKYMNEHFSPASNAHSYITRFNGTLFLE